ncbi:YceI family protein [Piscinibacter sp. HJYY11]|uniref:YceI family protein n=1 Tax=Piscinibacter sp. HJYY11 TaxID=2801333 RepID=UPI00191DD4AA|nr:YceI family protein [Piscinibacter sp. HJYY11]MBL0729252.1 polyisoprenoid-binding protein [Piscinibacter sp. HJYY11]
MKPLALISTLALACAAHAAPATYTVDPTHTFPSFEADHMGMSMWRGKINRNAGTITLDKAAGTGSVDITMDMASIDFGLDIMNSKAREPDLFDTAKYPQARYKGRLEGFQNGAPSRVVGELTLHGVTRPVTLTINTFKCMPHPMFKRDWCGADASATINRADFGIDAGKDWGFKMDVGLRIQVEAVQAE